MANEQKVQEKEKAKRRTYRDDNWTDEQVKARRAELTVEEAPEGWVKVSEVALACREQKVAISKLVRAFGGDRGMNPVAAPIFQFVYVGRTRYMAGEVLTEGLKMLANPEFLKTVRKKKAKKETAEGTGPVQPTKKTRRVKAQRPA